MRRFINKIIDRIQRKRAIKNHRKMWRWLAENPTKCKFDYLGSLRRLPKNACFLCDYALRVAKREEGDYFECELCPLDWGGRQCNEGPSLYEEWWSERYSKDINQQKVAELALQIAELPEKVEK